MGYLNRVLCLLNLTNMPSENKYLSHKKLTEDFISESIKTEAPAGLCFSTSFPLLIYLASKQIKSVLITAKVPKESLATQILKLTIIS